MFKKPIFPLDQLDQEYLSKSVRDAYLLGAGKKLLTDEDYKLYENTFHPISDRVKRMANSIELEPVNESMNFDIYEAAKQYSGLIIRHIEENQKEQLYLVRFLS